MQAGDGMTLIFDYQLSSIEKSQSRLIQFRRAEA
jgi:hypothetical protein